MTITLKNKKHLIPSEYVLVTFSNIFLQECDCNNSVRLPEGWNSCPGR